MATLYAGMLARLERDFVWGVCFLNLDTRRLLMTNSTFRPLHLSCMLHLILCHTAYLNTIFQVTHIPILFSVVAKISDSISLLTLRKSRVLCASCPQA